MNNLEPELWDFYYSPTMAASDNNLCHQVLGKPFTEAVEHTHPPFCNVTDSILVAERVPYNNETVWINPRLMSHTKQQYPLMGSEWYQDE